MTDIRRIDPHDDQQLRDWYDVTYAGAAAERTAPLIFAYEEIRESLRGPSTVTRRDVYAAYESEVMVAALKLDFPLQENLRLVEWTLNVAPDQRRKGYGTALFQFGLDCAAAQGRTVHTAEVDVPQGRSLPEHPGSSFALKHGFASQHSEDHLLRTLPVAAQDLQRLRDYAAPRHSDYEFVSWVGDCPEAHLEAYARLRTAMERDVPTGELDREPIVWDVERLRHNQKRMAAQGLVAVVTAAAHADHGFCGYTLMFAPEHNPQEVYQDDTLVLSQHRGHRLGTAMKARNMQLLQQEFDGRARVHTWTAGTNAAMRKVNADFGFETVESMHEFERTDPT